MSRTQKAIPTEYNGIKFRSRLEARWAVFFDTLRVKYFYEYEGYQLASGWYVPDFFLPYVSVSFYGSVGCFVEIKPTKPTVREEKLCNELAAMTHKHVFLLYGIMDNPYCFDDYSYWYPAGGVGNEGWLDSGYAWCECPKCGKIGMEFEGRGARICRGRCGGDPHDDKGYTSGSPRLLSAYNKAQKYKFW